MQDEVKYNSECEDEKIKELLKLLNNMGKDKTKITDPEHAYLKLIPWADKPQEHFLVITLNGNHEIINIHEVSKGLVNRTMVHPREVFRPTILDNSAAIIVAP